MVVSTSNEILPKVIAQQSDG